MRSPTQSDGFHKMLSCYHCFVVTVTNLLTFNNPNKTKTTHTANCIEKNCALKLVLTSFTSKLRFKAQSDGFRKC